MKVHLTCEGTRPLFMHNGTLSSSLNAYARQLKALNAKRNKTDEDRLEIARVEFQGGLWYEEELGPCMPAENIFKCLILGGRLIKAGKKIERGVSLLDLFVPVLYAGPRDRDSLWGNGDSPFVDIRPVVVQGNRIDRCRPLFRQWSLGIDAVLDPQVLEVEELARVAVLSGQQIGLGDYRLHYGRFRAEVTVL